MEDIELELTEEMQDCMLKLLKQKLDPISATLLEEVSSENTLEEIHLAVGKAFVNNIIVQCVEFALKEEN